MTNKENILFEKLYPDVAEDFHAALDCELENVIEKYQLSNDMAIRMIETFYDNKNLPKIHNKLIGGQNDK